MSEKSRVSKHNGKLFGALVCMLTMSVFPEGGAARSPRVDSGPDGSWNGTCRTKLHGGQLECQRPCTTTLVPKCAKQNQQYEGNVTHRYCRCNPFTAEPTCCHGYDLYDQGIRIGFYAGGYCGSNNCSGGQGMTCQVVTQVVPPGSPSLYHATCGN